MAFDDRLQFLLLGMAIGFVLGYLVRLVRDIKEELDEVKEEIEEVLPSRKNNNGGFIKIPLRDIAILLVVGLTAWAAFVSQKASNDVENSQDRSKLQTACTIAITGEALDALNQRSTFTKAAADANIELQQSQSDFFGLLLHQPPFSETRRAEAAQQYFGDLQQFLVLAKKSSNKVSENPFPTVKDLQNCLDGKTKEKK